MSKNIYLIGGKLLHSISPEVHRYLGSYSYLMKELDMDEVEDFIKSNDYDGFNVTIPYKKTVLEYVDELSETAARTGAVNTVIRKNGKLYGDNTDYAGFAFLLKYHNIDVKNKSVYILGDGGAASTVRAVMIDGGANEIINFTHEEISRLVSGKCDILVNCTPAGMFPETEVSPADLDILTVDYAVIDLVYNPKRTSLLLQAEGKNLIAVNGLTMLVAQAAHSAKYFGGKLPDDNDIAAIIQQIAHQRSNLVLIGFGGSGKSTVAFELHKITGRPVVDTDNEIEKIAGRTVTEILMEEGEKEFRNIERREIRSLVGKAGLIIATGGGAVLDDESARLLKQCGKVLFLRRAPVEKDFVGRPLYKSFSDAEKAYAERLPLYEKTADIILDNDHTKSARETALEIYDEIIGN